jgi:hypothetical protein
MKTLSPVLFIIFNRMNTTKEVFAEIQKAKPPRLYIASDGPRIHKENETAIVNEIRSYVLDNINWDCDVHTLFREQNLSCGQSVKGAIDWFFEAEEYGIVLEDDVKPNGSFFKFCDELLLRYKDDDRVGLISGNNHINFAPHNDSYTFSRFFSTWGWASWRRAWKNMDIDMHWFQTPYKNSIIRNMGYTQQSVLRWEKNINDIVTKKINAWDFQWVFSLSAQNQLCIFPACNLVANIGFGEDATHTFGEAKEEFLQQSELSFPLIHPDYIVPNPEFEILYEKNQTTIAPLWKRMIPIAIKQYIKRLLGRQ